MSTRYGLQRMALLNSAGYDYAIIPLDASIGLLANNNAGKTSLINALQFPLVPDRRRLSFGGHSVEDSRRFYFPADSSYVLVELLTRGGTVVVGCVGKGTDHDFEHFAYAGSLDLEDYRTQDNQVVRQAALPTHMADRGYTVFRYPSDVFRDRLFCRQRNVQPGEPDFGLFRVRAEQDPDTFQTIFTRVLRLDDLSADSIKRDLLELYRNDMRSNVNFRKEWEQAFAQVNADTAQLQAAIRCAGDIEKLEELSESRTRLRSRVLHQMPRIDAALEGWQAHYFENDQALRGETAVLKGRLDQAQEQRDQAMTAASRFEYEQEQLANEDQELAGLADGFLGVESLERDHLVAAAEDLARRRHALESQLKDAGQGSVATWERELAEQRAGLAQLQRRRDAAGDTMHAELAQCLSPEQLSAVERVLSPSALSHGAGHFRLDDDVATGIRAQENWIHLAGIAVDVDGLPRQYEQRSAAELDEEIELKASRLPQLEETLAAARDRQQQELKLKELKDQQTEANERLARFDRWQELSQAAPVRHAQLATLADQISHHKSKRDEAVREEEEYRRAMSTVGQRLLCLQGDNREVTSMQSRRRERSSRWLAGMEHKATNPSYTSDMPELIPFGLLREAMQDQQSMCIDLEGQERETQDLLDQINRQGLTKFAGDGGTDAQIAKIIDYHESRVSEEAALMKNRQVASVSVSSALAHLRDGLRAFEARVASFNRLIARRAISDLAVFRINLVHEQQLIDDIETVLSNLDTEDTDQLSLMESQARGNQGAVAAALQRLLKQHELRVESLFALEFEVGKKGQSAMRHRTLKGAASDGTTAMAKLVIGLAMLSELRDPRHEVRAVAYLDEAARLDESNQRSLIAVAESFGFSLVLAAPSQLVPPAYCVPIDRAGTKSRIDASRWMSITDRVAITVSDQAPVEVS